MADTPDTNPSTIGVSDGNPDLGMPPFAVDVVGGQGNGDMSDAVISLRGKISNDPGTWGEVTYHAVSLSPHEAQIVEHALRVVNPEEVDDFCFDPGDAEAELDRLADRFAMVPD